jgi:tetratricopeptide (TPR) repeat protein
LVTVWFQHHRAMATLANNATLWERICTAGWAIWFYLAKVFWPFHLGAVYPFGKADAAKVTGWLGVLMLIALVLALLAFKTRHSKAALFALCLYIVPIIPILGFFNMSLQKYSLVADHLQYFALPGICWLVGALLGRISLQPVRLAVITVVIVTLTSLAWGHSRYFHDEEALWRNTLKSYPKSSVALNNLTTILLIQKRDDEARQCSEQSLAINPSQFEPHYTLGIVNQRHGDIAGAIEEYKAALRCEPKAPWIHCNLGEIYVQQEKILDAEAEFREAVKQNQNFTVAQYDLGILLLRVNKVDEAIQHFRKAVEVQPDFAPAWLNLGVAISGKDPAEARRCFERLLQLDSSNADGHFDYGVLLTSMGDYSASRYHLTEALKLKPDAIETLNALAWCIARDPASTFRDHVEAIRLAKHGADLSQYSSAKVLKTLAVAAARAEIFTDAVAYGEKARSIALSTGNSEMVSELDIYLTGFRQHLPSK